VIGGTRDWASRSPGELVGRGTPARSMRHRAGRNGFWGGVASSGRAQEIRQSGDALRQGTEGRSEGKSKVMAGELRRRSSCVRRACTVAREVAGRAATAGCDRRANIRTINTSGRSIQAIVPNSRPTVAKARWQGLQQFVEEGEGGPSGDWWRGSRPQHQGIQQRRGTGQGDSRPAATLSEMAGLGITTVSRPSEWSALAHQAGEGGWVLIAPRYPGAGTGGVEREVHHQQAICFEYRRRESARMLKPACGGRHDWKFT